MRLRFKESFRPVSDGLTLTAQGMMALPSAKLGSVTATCKLTYGFLPCTTGLWGELFLVVVYEYLLALAGQYVSSGSSLFFRMFGTGIFGASVFQILGVIPQSVIMLATGISSSTDTIETMASMNIAMVAGSAILSLTLVWGSIVAFGSHDLVHPSSATSQSNQKPFSLTGYGVETDADTKSIARIMIVSLIPFLILQLAKIINSSTGTRIVVLITLVITLAFLITYCTYQILQPWIQEKMLDYILCLHGGQSVLQSLLTVNGKPHEDRIKDIFSKIDQDKDSKVSLAELHSFVFGLQMGEVGLSSDIFTTSLMSLFDVSLDQAISESDFVQGISKWLNQVKLPENGLNSRRHITQIWNRKSEGNSEEQQNLLSQSQDMTLKSKNELQTWWNYAKAAFLVMLGTAIMALLGMPLMESLDEFGTSAGIPSFFMSYVLLPLAMSFRQALAAISSAKKKTVKDISLTFTELYNGVFMNNVVGLTIFLALVYIRDISWDASAEVLVVLLICTLMGVLTSISTKFPVWTCILAIALYPLSLLLLYVLTCVLGWS